MNPFKTLLQPRGPDKPIGTWIMSASPIVAEAIGLSGFDWAVVDMEHSPLDLGDVVHLLQALAGTPMVPVLRVPWNDTVTIKRVLDAGATTLLVPFVQDADEARRAVAATRYPPQGIRGMAGMSRGSRFGTAPNYLTTANEGQCVIVQLETPQAVAQLEAIGAVEGVDAFFLGPADLSASMGHVGQLTHPAVMALMADAVQRCHALGKPVGIVGGTPEVVAQYRALGFDFLAIASDLGLLMRGAQAAAAALRAQGQGAPAATPGPASGY
ncbi:HpcH/HpaI aldolase/citrate lyase family protein [Ideonella sp. A 288]|uniref:HpcH/HpaI aldolase family protein n=1 Tax=Ideonella sp. A 288 TaxID=1962181 RepID=UPI000B4A8D01|nr:HpcH/HpaI aldolase/citrate lyase family protein [Ideonella sp. A 288]